MFYELGRHTCEDAREGFVYECMFPAERSLPTLPRYMFGDVSSELLRFYLSQHGVWEVGIWTAENITIAGPGLLSRNDRRFGIRETNTFEAAYVGHARLHNVSSPSIDANTSAIVDGVLLVGPGYPVYGHWLVDILPKLYLLFLSNISIRETKFLLPADCPKFGIELLGLLGVPNENMIFFDPVAGCTFKRVIVPTLLRTNSRVSSCFGAAIAFLMQRLRATVPKLDLPTSKKIFVSRAHWTGQGRRLINRPEIETLAQELGYTLYSPETESIPNQIQTFLNAETCAGEYGSAMHNTIFCVAGTPVCILRWPLIDPAFLQSGIGAALQQPTGYVIGKISGDELGFVVAQSDARDALTLSASKDLLM